jgi:hypothetical protein
MKDVDLASHHIVVRNGQGGKDRVTLLALRIKAHMQCHVHDVKKLHVQDVEKGCGRVYLPYALKKKYPNIDRE